MSRAMDILGVLSPGAVTLAEPKKGDPTLVQSLLPGGVGGVVGALATPSHRVLGFLGGEALTQNAYRLWRNQGSDRPKALSNIGMAGAGIVGSLMSPNHPFWGWVGGMTAGIVATSFVPGSNAHSLKAKLFNGGK